MKNARSGPSTLFERRYVEPRQVGDGLIGASLLAGGFLLGAGVWDLAVASSLSSLGIGLLLGGVAGLGVFAIARGRKPSILHIGDAGIGLSEGGAEVQRIPWYEVRKVKLTESSLTIESESRELSVDLTRFPVGVARVVEEARSRRPTVLALEASAEGKLVDLKSDATRLEALEPVQITGRVCAISKKPITFEADARLCSGCAEIFLSSSLPGDCPTCGKHVEP